MVDKETSLKKEKWYQLSNSVLALGILLSHIPATAQIVWLRLLGYAISGVTCVMLLRWQFRNREWLREWSRRFESAKGIWKPGVSLWERTFAIMYGLCVLPYAVLSLLSIFTRGNAQDFIIWRNGFGLASLALTVGLLIYTVTRQKSYSEAEVLLIRVFWDSSSCPSTTVRVAWVLLMCSSFKRSGSP